MNTKLSNPQTAILDYFEANPGETLTAKEMAYASPYTEKKTGLTAPSVTSNCKKLTAMGLLSQGKKGRAAAWTRTEMARPESADEYKARMAAEKEAQERREGKIATCQGCLRGICLHDGQDPARRRMVRHGWVSGVPGDKHAWHVGQCLGTAEKPLEDDYKVALDCMVRIMDKIELTQHGLETLLARPAQVSRLESDWNSETRRNEKKVVHYARDDKDMGSDSPSYYNKYESILRGEIREARMYLGSLARDLSAFHQAVSRIWDNKDVAAVFMKAEPKIREAQDGSAVKGYAWIQEAA